MLLFYQQRYQQKDIGIVLRALVYFVDAEIETNPKTLKPTKWEAVKTTITQSVRQYIHLTIQ